ncbi:MAG: hypothetical protein ACAI35_02155 [Candidatus Methylacidiphilales bacterium]|nr:hypothetical protein [Candidatus Methylacidiphilales bacterium]
MDSSSASISTNDLHQALAASGRNQPAPRSHFFDGVMCLLIVVAFYLLSYGPMAMMYRQDILSSNSWHAQPVHMLYIPIEWAMQDHMVREVMGGYIHLCESACGMRPPG